MKRSRWILAALLAAAVVRGADDLPKSVPGERLDLQPKLMLNDLPDVPLPAPSAPGAHPGEPVGGGAASELDVKRLESRVEEAKKTAAFDECLRAAGVLPEEVAYMGDDLPDIPLAQRAGLGVCVANGAPELKAVCHFTTQREGGRGAAREVIELILKSQGRWEEAVPKALA